MKQLRSKSLCLLVLVLALLLGACGEGEPAVPAAAAEKSENTLSLWAAEDAPLCAGLEALVRRYNGAWPEEPVVLRLFPSEQAMCDALETDAADLLLCTQTLAQRLDGRSELRQLVFEENKQPRYLPAFAAQEAAAGYRFVPLGAEIPVLAVGADSAALAADCGSLEALCAVGADYAAQKGRPFFAVDAPSGLFAAAFVQKGGVFCAQSAAEDEPETYREVYNLLANAVFDGAMALEPDSALPALAEGELACVLCGSRALCGMELEGICLLPVPPMAGCAALAEAEIWGLAAMADEASVAGAAAFVSWLCRYENAAELALSQGLAPASPGAWETSGNALAEGLDRAAAGCGALLPPPEESERAAREAFDRQLRETLAQLQESW